MILFPPLQEHQMGATANAKPSVSLNAQDFTLVFGGNVEIMIMRAIFHLFVYPL